MVALMGYGPEDKNAVLELTYNYGITEYNKGNGYTQVNSYRLQKHILQ
jgi:lactoylglutathione lyase